MLYVSKEGLKLFDLTMKAHLKKEEEIITRLTMDKFFTPEEAKEFKIKWDEYCKKSSSRFLRLKSGRDVLL